MAVSYKKLWKLLIEKDMKKTDLRIKAGISTGALAKLGKNENVNTEILGKICKVLKCGVLCFLRCARSVDKGQRR